MKKLLSVFGILLSLLSAAPLHAQGVESVAPSCLKQVYTRMTMEEHIYRSVLFGQKKSADLAIGSARFDIEGNSWMKTGRNQWRSLDTGFSGTTWSDILMDERADAQPRRGIFEVKSAPTSDLLPPLLQSMRALQCRLRAVCENARLSQGKQPGDMLTVEPDGCIESELPAFDACTVDILTDVGVGSCDASADAIIEREMKLLETVIAYDAAYRSLMQFAGIFEGFLADFRFPLVEPIWQMVRTFGQLDGLPCFIGQCDE